MSRIRTVHYYMTAEERRTYNRIKQREYRERIAEIKGKPIKPYNPVIQ